MTRYLFTFGLILFAAFSRLLPHPVNMAPICAIALFGGAYLDKKHAFIVPLAAMVISDYFIGFYSGILWTYAAFLLVGVVGLTMLRKNRSTLKVLGGTVAGSVIFFVVSNFGTWASGFALYPMTAGGLVQCYTMAIPFFRNSLVGDLGYVTVLFGAYELAKRYVPSMEPQAV